MKLQIKKNVKTDSLTSKAGYGSISRIELFLCIFCIIESFNYDFNQLQLKENV